MRREAAPCGGDEEVNSREPTWKCPEAGWWAIRVPASGAQIHWESDCGLRSQSWVSLVEGGGGQVTGSMSVCEWLRSPREEKGASPMKGKRVKYRARAAWGELLGICD